MTPKQKAIDLYNKFYNTSSHPHHVETRQQIAKECALIAVDEIIQGIYHIDHKHTAVYDDKGTFYNYKECQELKYWKEVKQEIEKL